MRTRLNRCFKKEGVLMKWWLGVCISWIGLHASYYENILEEAKSYYAVVPQIIEQTKLLLEQQQKNRKRPLIIAIAGCSGVGKSWFAKYLAEGFSVAEIKAAVLRQDHFMDPTVTIADYIIHPHLDYRKIYEFFNRIMRYEQLLQKPKFDWSKKIVIQEEFDITGADVLLFEGTYALCGSESLDFAKYGDLCLFIDAEESDIIAWNWIRENSGKVKHTPREREKFDQDIAWDMQDYRENILPSKKNADMIIRKNLSHECWLINTR
jgi:uridine kinase